MSMEERGFTHYYIGIHRENGGDYKSPVSSVEHFLTTDCKSVGTPNGVHAISIHKKLKINNLKVSLCKLRQFHCADCGIFNVQVVDFHIDV